MILKVARSKRRDRDQRRGATTVEFACIAPILFFIVFAFFDMLSAYSVFRTADQGMFRAIRKGTLPGSNDTQLRAEIKKEVDLLGLEIEKMTIENNDFEGDTVVEVKIDISLERTSWLAPLVLRNRFIRMEYDRIREDFPIERQLVSSVFAAPPRHPGFNLRRQK